MESDKNLDDNTISHSISLSAPHLKEKIFITTKIKRHKNWSREEDQILLEIAQKYREKSWTKVSLFFNDKNPAQCRARYKRIRPGIIKGPWTKDEDKLIIELVNQTGRNWALISKLMPTRNGKQIRDRFINYLDPKINKLKFSEEEDKKIIELYIKHGSKWSVISKSFEGRTGDMIKNRFYSCLKRRIHVYEVQNGKRSRKKYYKSKKGRLETQENPVFTPASERVSSENINPNENESPNKSKKLPMISININQNNSYSVPETLGQSPVEAEVAAQNCKNNLPVYVNDPSLLHSYMNMAFTQLNQSMKNNQLFQGEVNTNYLNGVNLLSLISNFQSQLGKTTQNPNDITALKNLCRNYNVNINHGIH